MMGAARPALGRVPGLTFWKLCGAGSGAGFEPRLNMGVVGLLCVWESAGAADAALEDAPIFAAYRRRASEHWTIRLATVSARGRWSGRVPFDAARTTAEGPLAVLTRATLRPRALPGFWPRVPGVSAAVAGNRNVLFRIGLGEVPFLQQITFSVWPDAAAMRAFAGGGHHARAVAAVRRGNWFREELYARFVVTGEAGTWGGRCDILGAGPRAA